MQETVSNVFQTIPLQAYVLISSALFALGVVGVLIRRNMLVVLMSIEIMLNAVNLLLAATAAYRNDPAGQVFVFFIMVVAAAEVAVGLGLMVMIYRNTGTIDIRELSRLKG